MTSEVKIEIARDELFSSAVDTELARLRARRGGAPPEAPPLSPVRRVLYSNLFYLPAAAVLGALLAWAVIEPDFNDMPRVSGQVMFASDDPMVYEGMVSITVGGKQILLSDATAFEPGEDGSPAFASADAIEPGAMVDVVGIAADKNILAAMAVRPTTAERAAAIGVKDESGELVGLGLFLLTAVFIAFFLQVAEGIASRNWNRMLARAVWSTGLTALFSLLAMIPAGLAMTVGQAFLTVAEDEEIAFFTVNSMAPRDLFLFAVCRSAAWAAVGAGLGLGLNLVRATRIELRNSVLGGALGGAFGGLFFDPVDRFLGSASPFLGDAWLSRLIGLCMVGVGIGLFVALVDRLARVAWLRVRTGPLAGKAFVLYRSPTTIGSASSADIYLFKDAEIDPEHARIHQVGRYFEIEDAGSRTGLMVGGQAVRRKRLVSGEQIVLGNTVLEFEERAKSTQ